MQGLTQRQPSVDSTRFAMVPRADIPRSTFRTQHTHKTTFSASRLIPVFVDEVLPGDSFNLKMTAFVRMATPLYPIMDNMRLDSFFFFVPSRLLWTNFRKFMGEQNDPGDSISFVVPQITSPVGGFPRFSIYDYMGLPCAPTLGANTVSINALPLRAYEFIYREWFRDQNLVANFQTTRPVGDGPDTSITYRLETRAKGHDYFTSALPWTQKGTSPPLFVGGTANVRALSAEHTTSGANAPLKFRRGDNNAVPGNLQMGVSAGDAAINATAFTAAQTLYPTNLYTDLSTATSNTINQLRLAFAIQRLLERDARGGTRYTEMVRSHFGVVSPDGRLQRPEYLGGGRSDVNIVPIPQQSATGLTGGTTPVGTLGGVGVATHSVHGFSQSFTEHGFIIGIVCVTADRTYQQGIRRMWKRTTRYDHYFPVFAHLGEQAVFNYELYADGSAADNDPFGYQERWAEYRHHPSRISGAFSSTFTTPLDAWHLAQRFTSRPTLNATFILDGTDAVLRRALAAGALADDQQFLADIFFDLTAARPMPAYSVPGMLDHF